MGKKRCSIIRYTPSRTIRTQTQTQAQTSTAYPPPPAPSSALSHPSAQQRQPRTISDLLRSSNLTGAEIHRVETALQNREDQIRQRDRGIQERDRRNRSLGRQNGELKRTLEEKGEEKRELQSRHSGLSSVMGKKEDEFKDLTERAEIAEGLMRLGRECLEKKEEEIARLKTRVEEAEGMNAELREQVIRIGMANQTEAMAMANQMSADRTLELIKGLQRDIEQRDEEVRRVGEENRSLNVMISKGGEEVQFLKQRIEQMVERERESARDVERWKKEVDGWRVEVKKWKRNGEERDAIAREQQELIERLIRGS